MLFFRPAGVLVVCAVYLTGAACGTETAPDAARPLCVFDYDLTLSSHACTETEGRPEMHCRTTACVTYNWYTQCLGVGARDAVAECVRREAFIAIASHASVDLCWNDKVTPIVTEMQFPEWTGSPAYASQQGPLRYPPLDDRGNWNCADCAYTMDGGVSKPEDLRRAMRHYGLDPASAADRRRIVFWDDEPANIAAVRTELPEAVAMLVPRHGPTGNDGGCGITRAEIDEAWRRSAAP